MLALAAVAFGAFAFKGVDGGTIAGKVTPAEGATEAWAIQGTDTLTSPVTDGGFNFANAKAGAYTVIKGAKAPFKPATVTDVRVEEGKSTDLGEIKLAK
ncbi:carboxypeptidase-like regulatory domain-containing protein [Chitinophaga sp. 22321]|uniref:Carboxypeptidase regulatory-like domain-containing protein n=1 Tax=Chitinophaga hostae TaxID=2831022 RepID=A0ABS5J072_9BACT|nr:carboxypeptidase-like regulatory domain-containing protein [Chitinophaga hostae]MBS0028636.1 carboxypeptidase regulatory-like domain-containing protein [Chitinophaga hostae]